MTPAGVDVEKNLVRDKEKILAGYVISGHAARPPRLYYFCREFTPPVTRNPMKKIFRLILVFPFACTAIATGQPVNETVSFDNYVSAADNDFVNRFDNGTGLNQLQTNGISGGCLETPATISWGNDNAVYCTRFKGVIGVNYITGICFRYDTSQLNNINFDRAASLWMKPGADPNHYLVASVINSRQIQVISYSATSASLPMTLQQDHWYNLLLIADFAGGTLNDQVNVNAQVNDLGVTGNDPPFPTGFTNLVLHDSVLIADTAIEVSLTGTSWGGALYLDNFRFDGMKSFDYCITTGIADAAGSEAISCSLDAGLLSVHAGTAMRGSKIRILDLSGRALCAGEINAGVSTFNLSGLADGIYLVTVTGGRKQVTKKIILMR